MTIKECLKRIKLCVEYMCVMESDLSVIIDYTLAIEKKGFITDPRLKQVYDDNTKNMRRLRGQIIAAKENVKLLESLPEDYIFDKNDAEEINAVINKLELSALYIQLALDELEANCRELMMVKPSSSADPSQPPTQS